MWSLMKNKKLLLIGLVFSNFVFANDQPDFRYEKKLHKTYVDFYSKPTDQNLWGSVISGKVDSFEVSSEDNLWSISEVLFGDSQFWPKIWSLNSEKIQNPHQIFPGQVILFKAGTLTEAPQLSLENADKVASNDEKSIVESMNKNSSKTEGKDAKSQKTGAASLVGELDPKIQELMSLANIPINEDLNFTESRKVPASIPSWSYATTVPHLTIETSSLLINPKSPPEPMRYFLSSEELVGDGKVESTEGGYRTAADYQYVDLEFSNPTSENQFYALSKKGKIKDPVSGDTVLVYQLEGMLERKEVVNQSKNLYRAIVTRAYNPIQTDSLILKGSPPQFSIHSQKISQGKGVIVGGETQSPRSLLHQGSIVFLSGADLQEGTLYPIYRKNQLRVGSSLEFENPRKIGQLKVIRKTEKFATAIITSAMDDIVVGDITDPSLLTIE